MSDKKISDSPESIKVKKLKKEAKLTKGKKSRRTPDLSKRPAANKWLNANPQVRKIALEIIKFCDQFRVPNIEYGWFNRSSSHVFKYGNDSVGARLGIRCKKKGCTLTVTLPKLVTLPKNIQHLFKLDDNELKYKAFFEVGQNHKANYNELLKIVETNVITPLAKIDTSYEDEPEKYINEFINDFDKLNGLTETERDALVKTRIGQGKFRKALDNLWGESCALTGLECRDLLRASHIKAWRDAEAHERIDPYNGLLLAAHLDALFDKGLISFDPNGLILISDELSSKDLEKLSLSKNMKISMCKETKSYMKHHRKKYKY
ncbi:hypothetical protein CWC02_18900 [Pseudoalteromonas sp. S2721]|uniref:HNH endonuclease n=1 Tax=Pseudoalteromonas sp. S2721 TaxID=579526 RepID=UPI00110B704D|nr:HNH endonuclease [Pseudoalteromonas sp. S2721]TMP14256.1 hypothetical protein CWC02_18900 [Pseudoalteromonas sp. S2721]